MKIPVLSCVGDGLRTATARSEICRRRKERQAVVAKVVYEKYAGRLEGIFQCGWVGDHLKATDARWRRTIATRPTS